MISFECVVVMKSNQHYRIGDLFYKKGFRWESDRVAILNNPEFKDTMMYKYLKEKKELDYKLLRRIIEELPYEKPSNNELVIHVRSGDVIHKSRITHLNYFNLISSVIKKHKIQKITVVTAMHYGDYKERELWLYTNESYLKNKEILTKFFKKLNNLKIPISLKSSNNIDDDFAYLVNAKFLVVDNGGYTELAKKLCKNVTF